MNHSKIGEIALSSWKKIVEYHPYVKLDAFVIMPNHVHGIIVIDKGDFEGSVALEGEDIRSGANDALSFQGEDINRSGANDAFGFQGETRGIASVRLEGQNGKSEEEHKEQEKGNRFGGQSRNLASIIRGYKSGVKKYATMNDTLFAWHPRYHDHIIRNEKEYHIIKSYIEENIQNWGKDKFHRNH